MENATIEERASNIVRKVCNLNFWNDKVDLDMRAVKNLMVQFATEQRDIDTKAAEDWFCLHECKHTGCVDDKTCGILEGLRNAMKGGSDGK